MKNNPLLALVACTLLASCSEPVTGPPVAEDLQPAFARGFDAFTPGEQQPTVDLASVFTYAIWPAGEGQNLAQTFSPRKNQKLGYLELPVGCTADVLLNVKIREGDPGTGTLLYDVNVAGLPEVVDGDFELIQVYDPATSNGIKIRKNRTYAFELAAFPANPNIPFPTCGMAPGPAGNSYTRGQGYYEDVPTNGPGFLPLPTGSAGDDEDLAFITRVR